MLQEKQFRKDIVSIRQVAISAMVGPLVHVCTLFLRKPVAFREFFLAEAHDGLLGPEQIVRLIERLDEALSVDDAAAIAAQLLEHAGGAPRVSLSRLSAVADATVQRARARAAFWSAARKVCLLIFVYLPLLAAALAAGFGALLALVEGWSYADSFWVVLAELSMTTIEIVETEAPDSDLGRVAGCIVGALQLAIFGGVCGVFGGPLLDELLGGAAASFRPLDDELHTTASPHETFLVETARASADACAEHDGAVARSLRPDASSLPAHARDARTGAASVEWLCRKLLRFPGGLRAVFDEFDTSGDGMIDADELSEGIERSGPLLGIPADLPAATVAAMFRRLDIDGDGRITFEEASSRMREIADTDRLRVQVRDVAAKLALFALLIVPLLALALAALFGALLCVAEGWGYRECFYLVLAGLTGTTIDVVPHEEHARGPLAKLVACAVGLVSLAIFAAVIGVIGGPLIEPLAQAAGLGPFVDADDDYAECAPRTPPTRPVLSRRGIRGGAKLRCPLAQVRRARARARREGRRGLRARAGGARARGREADAGVALRGRRARRRRSRRAARRARDAARRGARRARRDARRARRVVAAVPRARAAAPRGRGRFPVAEARRAPPDLAHAARDGRRRGRRRPRDPGVLLLEDYAHTWRGRITRSLLPAHLQLARFVRRECSRSASVGTERRCCCRSWRRLRASSLSLRASFASPHSVSRNWRSADGRYPKGPISPLNATSPVARSMTYRRSGCAAYAFSASFRMPSTSIVHPPAAAPSPASVRGSGARGKHSGCSASRRRAAARRSASTVGWP